MNNKSNNDDVTSIWDKRYQDGKLACTQEIVEADPIDYTQHPFLYKESTAKRLTGDLEGDSLKMIADKFLTPPAKKMLAVGCGLAFKEESFVKDGYVEYLVAFESSLTAVESVRERVKSSGLQDKIEIHAEDVINANLEDASFDVVYIQAAIHHFYNIEEMYELFHRVLKPGGLLLFDEYIGPDHHMYESEVIELMDEVNDCLSPSLRWDVMRKETRVEIPQATLDWMLDMDPSEGVHSSEILPLTYKYFDVEYRNDYGGTFMRPFFVGILPNFNFDDEKDQSISRLIILMEEMLLRYGVIPSYHTWVVGKKRDVPRPSLTSEEVKRINYSNWEGWDKYGKRSEVSKVLEFTPSNYSDENWEKGVGVFGEVVFFLSASRHARQYFTIGREITLSDDSKRKIFAVKQDEQSLVVTLSGNSLDPNVVGYPNIMKLDSSEVV